MKRTIEKIVEYAASVANPERIILFGSMAQKRDNIYSDIDLLIVSENPELKREVMAKVTNYAMEFSLKTDVLFYSQSEIKRACQTPNSFLNSALKTGKIVYDKSTQPGFPDAGMK